MESNGIILKFILHIRTRNVIGMKIVERTEVFPACGSFCPGHVYH